MWVVALFCYEVPLKCMEPSGHQMNPLKPLANINQCHLSKLVRCFVTTQKKLIQQAKMLPQQWWRRQNFCCEEPGYSLYWWWWLIMSHSPWWDVQVQRWSPYLLFSAYVSPTISDCIVSWWEHSLDFIFGKCLEVALGDLRKWHHHPGWLESDGPLGTGWGKVAGDVELDPKSTLFSKIEWHLSLRCQEVTGQPCHVIMSCSSQLLLTFLQLRDRSNGNGGFPVHHGSDHVRWRWEVSAPWSRCDSCYDGSSGRWYTCLDFKDAHTEISWSGLDPLYPCMGAAPHLSRRDWESCWENRCQHSIFL